MKGFTFLGDPPQIESDSVIGMSREVTRYDMVTFERFGTRKIIMRTVKPDEYAGFAETLYQID